jgi:hypothetical protein
VLLPFSLCLSVRPPKFVENVLVSTPMVQTKTKTKTKNQKNQKNQKKNQKNQKNQKKTFAASSSSFFLRAV